jgi:hypothetical protein
MDRLGFLFVRRFLPDIFGPATFDFLLRFEDELGGREGEGFGFDGFGDAATADALGADSLATDFAVGQRNFDAFQVRAEFSLRDSGDFGTDTAQILGNAANFNLLAAHWLLATNFTFPSHSHTFHKR